MKNPSFFIAVVSLLLLCNIKQYSLGTRLSLNSTNTDQNALLAFKKTITSDPHGILAENWSENVSVCHWFGVTCGIKHQRVISLRIPRFNLSGTMSPHLGNLTFLRYLDITSNYFTGNIPSELSNLYHLREIHMGFNSFTGEIPSWLGALPRLEQLRLSNNTFSGRIPPYLFNNSKLQAISLDYNQLTGSIPYVIFNVSSIRDIRISYNYLSGMLPSDMCNNLPNLKMLYLWHNQLEGQIPPNIYKCRDIEYLELSENHFNGKIPSEIGRLSMLRELSLGFNDFMKGGVPVEFGNLSRLEILSLPSASLTGLIPNEIWNCTSLKSVELGHNYLTGELRQEVGNLASLELLGVFNNSLFGSIPSSIFNISTLKILELSYNQFSSSLRLPSKLSISNLEMLYLHTNRLSGEIPSSITNASKLILLDLSDNSFSGSIPNFGNLRHLHFLGFYNNNLSGIESPDQELTFLSSLINCQHLRHLVISENPLNGILPSSIGNLSTSLETFWADYCNIKGVIPSEIGNLSSLRYLILGQNQFRGFIPPTIGKLKQLQRLYIEGNRLQGYIPPDLCQLSNMGELYLSDNVLTGPIPECLGEVKSLRDIYLGSNKLNSTIPSNLWNLKDLIFLDLSSNSLSGLLSSQISSLKAINGLNLSHNQFSGNITSSIDGCQSLEFLSLSNNNFEGSIPPSLGNIKVLSTLDLSNNNLSGSIPKSLENLHLLHYFNMSYNKLEGEIPNRGPFVNITAQSFVNNSALCGVKRFQVPPCAKKNNTRSRRQYIVRLMKYILPPFIFVIIVATIIILVLMRRRRKLRRVSSPAHDISLGVSCRRVSYIELLRGTNGFSETNMLGKGSFGSVFKGTLSDGLNIAVKVFNLQLERTLRSFDTESEILSSVRHRNLVRIIGCCSNTEFKALILAYMSNGSLEKWLYSENYCLDLIQRLKIAIDVALALEYLHHGHTFPVVHCDIKPSNVLLDEDMTAHLCDFGIAKLFDEGETMVQTKTLATIGYAAPEYGSEGKVSPNGDVYSYGILLLEMFTGKKPTDDMFNEEMSLKDCVHEALQENAVSEIVAPGLLPSEDQYFSAKEECVSSIFSLGMKCLVISSDERINMNQTVAALQRIKAKVVASTTRRQRYALSNVTSGQ